MISYKDMTFCSRNNCVNMKCQRNNKHIPENVGLPVSYSGFSQCKEFKKSEVKK